MVSAPPRASGLVLPAWRSVLVVMEHHWRWYRRGWRATAVSSTVQPLLFLLAFGVGFCSLVDAGGRAAQSGIGGVSYLVYLAPGLLAMSAVQTAAFEIEGDVIRALYVVRNPDKLRHLAPTQRESGPE